MEALARLPELLGLGPETVFAAVAVFARMSGALFFLPGLSERVVPVQIRLAGGLALTALVLPAVAAEAPRDLDVAAGLAVIAAEAITGLWLGLGLRIVIFALQISGTVISQTLSVANGFVGGMTIDLDTSVGTMLSLAGVAILLAAGLHGYFVGLFTASYGALPFGEFPPASALAETLIARTGWAVRFGVTLAMPFIVVSFVYNLALGALNRAMPQLMVAFVGAPAIMAIGLIGLALISGPLFDQWSAETGALYAEIIRSLG